MSVDGGTAKASGLKATLDKAALTGDAQLHAVRPVEVHRHADGQGGRPRRRRSGLAPDFRPPFTVQGGADVTADLHGTLSPLSVGASGTASGADLALNQFKVDSLSFKWDIDDDRVKLTDAKAKLYQGEASGTAVGADPGGGGRRRGPASSTTWTCRRWPRVCRRCRCGCKAGPRAR